MWLERTAIFTWQPWTKVVEGLPTAPTTSIAPPTVVLHGTQESRKVLPSLHRGLLPARVTPTSTRSPLKSGTWVGDSQQAVLTTQCTTSMHSMELALTKATSCMCAPQTP